jgi:hypothetical protein
VDTEAHWGGQTGGGHGGGGDRGGDGPDPRSLPETYVTPVEVVARMAVKLTQ